jgi:cell division protein FtsL
VAASPRERRRFVQRLLFLGICLVSLGLLHVWGRLQVVRLGYLLSTASKLRHQLEQENRELTLELASLSSPQRLEHMATRRLGLKEPEKNQVVILP